MASKEKLFASPRGNAVMKAKRVTGASAQTMLRIACAEEKCSTVGCNNVAPLRSQTINGTIKRTCASCLSRTGKQAEIKSRGWKPAWMA